MKKLFSLLAAAIAIGFVACNNEAETTAGSDTTTTTETTAATTTTSTGDYAAMADSFRVNSEAGNYLDVRTGKPIKLQYVPEKRVAVNVETGEPVWRYIDRRTWWVYGDNDSSWETMGTARVEKNKVEFQDMNDNNKWLTYEERWKTEDERMAEDFKKKYGDTKVKISKDGDIKVKDEKGKIKYDADDNKIKTDSSD